MEADAMREVQGGRTLCEERRCGKQRIKLKSR